MSWYKHYCSSSNDEKIIELQKEFGLLGYAYWFILLEKVYDHYWKTGELTYSVSVKTMSGFWHCSTTKVTKVVRHLSENFMCICSEQENYLKIEICNMLKYLGKDIKYDRFKRVDNDARIEKSREDKKEIHKEKSETVVSSPGSDDPGHSSLLLKEKKEHPLVKAWNEHCGMLPKVRELSSSRKRVADCRLKEHPDVNYWISAMKILLRSDFHTGKNKNGWRANFDYFIRPDTAIKLLESSSRNYMMTEEELQREMVERAQRAEEFKDWKI